MCCKQQTGSYCNMSNQLKECIKGNITITSNVRVKSENVIDVHFNGVIYRKKSPIGRHFELVYMNTLNLLSKVENVSQSNSPNNVSYSP